MYADVMPQFNGGEEELYKFISTHFNYPTLAKENGIKGNYYALFDGKKWKNYKYKSIEKSWFWL